MKLLILLFALLVRTNPSLSMPTPNLSLIFKEVKVDLRNIQQKLDGLKPEDLKQHLAVFNQTVKIQTPRNIKNACECGALYVQQLKAFIRLIEQIFSWDQIDNILDSLRDVHLHTNPNDNCKFHTHKMRDASLKDLFQDNIQFIENWNAICKKTSHKSN